MGNQPIGTEMKAVYQFMPQMSLLCTALLNMQHYMLRPQCTLKPILTIHNLLPYFAHITMTAAASVATCLALHTIILRTLLRPCVLDIPWFSPSAQSPVRHYAANKTQWLVSARFLAALNARRPNMSYQKTICIISQFNVAHIHNNIPGHQLHATSDRMPFDGRAWMMWTLLRR